MGVSFYYFFFRLGGDPACFLFCACGFRVFLTVPVRVSCGNVCLLKLYSRLWIPRSSSPEPSPSAGVGLDGRSFHRRRSYTYSYITIAHSYIYTYSYKPYYQAMSYHTTPCHTIPCHAMSCHTTSHHTTPHHTIPYHSIPIFSRATLMFILCHLPVFPRVV